MTSLTRRSADVDMIVRIANTCTSLLPWELLWDAVLIVRRCLSVDRHEPVENYFFFEICWTILRSRVSMAWDVFCVSYSCIQVGIANCSWWSTCHVWHSRHRWHGWQRCPHRLALFWRWKRSTTTVKDLTYVRGKLLWIAPVTRKPSIEAGIQRNAICYSTWNEIWTL